MDGGRKGAGGVLGVVEGYSTGQRNSCRVDMDAALWLYNTDR